MSKKELVDTYGMVLGNVLILTFPGIRAETDLATGHI
jgi:hypothetical protein